MEFFADHPEYLVFVNVVLLGAALYNAIHYLEELIKSSEFSALNKRANDVSQNSDVGDYVRIVGKVTFPANEVTPFEKIECDYWISKAWAVFKTKKKKPETGMVTHTPFLLTESSEKKPLILSDSSNVVAVNVQKFSSVFLNPSHIEKEYAQPPSYKIEELAKPKYEYYRVLEMWLPKCEAVMVLGTVESKNRSMTFVGASNDDGKQLIIFNGTEQEYKEYYSSRFRRALIPSVIFGYAIAAALVIFFKFDNSWMPTAVLASSLLVVFLIEEWKKR